MLRSFSVGMFIWFLSAFAACSAYAGEYVIDNAKSEFVVKLFKAGIASAIAHNHVIRATEYEGKVNVDPVDPSNTQVKIIVQADSLAVDETETRKKYGFEKSLKEKDRNKIRSTMLSEDQIDAGRYPTIEFESTHVEKESDERYIVTGNLKIHGVAQLVTFPATVKRMGGLLHGVGEIGFKQSDFGIKPYSTMFGALRNQDEAVLHISVFLTPDD